MFLQYKDLSSNDIMAQAKSIKYSVNELVFGFNTNVKIDISHEVDVLQIVQQADLFARQMYVNRSLFDFKRFMGPNQSDWLRMLHEVYVYDRCKNIYYGLNSIYRNSPPLNTFSFPGNILLRNYLSINQFNFSTGGYEDSFKIFVNLKIDRDYLKVLEEIQDLYPCIKEGMSSDGNNFIYSNVTYECILEGLSNGSIFLKSKMKDRSKNLPFLILPSNSEDMEKFVDTESSNPILNSFLSSDRTKFSFITKAGSEVKSSPMFEESLFISRALGFTSNSGENSLYGNSFYTTVPRNPFKDFLTREEVYSITGLKTEEIPFSYDQLIAYLSIRTLPDGTVESGLINFDTLRILFGEDSNPS